MRILVNPFEEAEQLVLENGQWVVGVLETRISWPKNKQTIHYTGKDFILLPVEHHTGSPIPSLPAIAIRADYYGLTPVEARKYIMQFASALSWREGAKIEIVQWSGGNLPRSMGIMRNNVITEYLEEEHLPIPQENLAETALAFYREGVSLDNPFYSFLSFYKAFSVAIENKKQRGTWMTEMRDMLDNSSAKERVKN